MATVRGLLGVDESTLSQLLAETKALARDGAEGAHGIPRDELINSAEVLLQRLAAGRQQLGPYRQQKEAA